MYKLDFPEIKYMVCDLYSFPPSLNLYDSVDTTVRYILSIYYISCCDTINYFYENIFLTHVLTLLGPTNMFILLISSFVDRL